MNMNKKIIILIVGLLTGVYATGQVKDETANQVKNEAADQKQDAKSQLKHEFSIYAGGGLSTLLYDLSTGKQNLGFGGLAGVGYTLFFNDYVGIGTGVEFALYNAKIKSDDFLSASSAVDKDGEVFLYKSRIENFQEKQTATFINIPLMLNLQSGGYHRFYGALGAKLGIPMSGSNYKYSAGTVTASGYYEHENLEYGEEHPFLGFGTFADGNDGKGDLKFKLAYLASAELGMKWSLGKNTALYTGFYVDYGLNDIRKKGEGIGNYHANDPQTIDLNSVLSSQYTKPNGKSQDFTDKVSPLAAGIKIKLAFGKGINKEKEIKEDETKKNKKDNSVEKKDSTDLKNSGQTEDELNAEREAYLREAAERRKNYKQALGNVNNYGLSVVTLNAEQKKNLNTYVEQMKREPGMNVNITGHTCDIGSDRINMQIGQERADLAKDYMVEEGISPSRIKTFTMGKNKPKVPNSSDANRKKNRRLEMQVVK
jgi:outer membrane protein OmpA-like peptidoglycan-associated protein